MVGKTVAVLGAGNAGHALASTLTLDGHDVRLFELPRFEHNLEPVRARGGIQLLAEEREHLAGSSEIPTWLKVGVTPSGFAPLDVITTDIETAIDGAEVILSAGTREGHRAFGELLAPIVAGDQTIIFFTGNTASLGFREQLAAAGNDTDPLVAETSLLPFMTRVVGPATVRVLFWRKWWLAANPADRTQDVLDVVDGLIEMHAGDNVLHTTLISANPVLHVAGTLLNAGAIENTHRFGGDYYMYSQGMTPAVYSVIKAVDEEKLAICRALGYEEVAISEYHAYTSWVFGTSAGPDSMQHRYLTEDVPIGTVLRESLGELAGVPTPVTSGLIDIANAVNDTDYRDGGATLSNLGFGDLSTEQLNKTLSEGPN